MTTVHMSKQEEEDAVKEMCTNNGLSYDNLAKDAGSVHFLDVFFNNFTKMVGMHYFTNLTKLCIIGQNIQTIEGLGAMKKLRELWVCETHLKTISGLGNCKLLNRLYLYDNRLTKIENLDNLTMLEYLWLNDNQIRNIDGTSCLTRLKELNIADNKIEKLGHSLDSNLKLENLNLSGNKIYSFKDLTHLQRLPNLKHLGLKDPGYAANPVCLLCNYSTHVLYHLPKLEVLDTHDVSSKTLRELAETTVVKKKMYYNMRVKTMRRNMSKIVTSLNSACDELLKIPHERLKTLIYNMKEIERLSSEFRQCQENEGGNESGTESEKDAKEAEAADSSKLIVDYKKKNDFIQERTKKWYKKCEELQYYFNEALGKLRQVTELTINRLVAELETGGNVRFEDGMASDVWFKSCHDLILSRFCAADYKDRGIYGVRIHRITRVHNRILRSKFDDKLSTLLDDDDNYLPTTRSDSYKKKLEYLFWKWDPELPGGLNEPARLLEEGFMDADTYKQLGKDGAVPLTNSLTIADQHRIEYLTKQAKNKPYQDTCPYRHGVLVVAKVYLGKSEKAATSDNNKLIFSSNYKDVETVYRPRTQVDKVATNSGGHVDMSDSGKTQAALIAGSTTTSTTSCDCLSRQCEWFVFDHEMVLPEYVIDFEYITRFKPKNPFMGIVDGDSDTLDVKGLVNTGAVDDSNDDDILNMTPQVKTRPRIVQLTDETILKHCNVHSLLDIVELNLHGNGLTRLKNLASLPQLRKLIVSFNELMKLDDITHLGLEYVDASHNKIMTLDGMKGMTKLKHLDLSWNLLHSTREELSILRKHTPHLEFLNTLHNRWQKEDGLRLRAIGRLKSLQMLDGTPVIESENTAALRMAAGSRISQVSLLAQSRTDQSRPRSLSLNSYAQVLAQTSRHKPDRVGEQDNLWYSKVTTLNLDGQHISKLSNLERLENLKWASFNDNDITKIEGLDACVNLEELSLDKNCISRVENLGKLTKLRRLSLSENYISTLENAGLEKLVHLHCLAVDNNKLTTLLGLHRVSTLIELYIGNNNITNIREIFHLKNLNNFVILDLYGNPVGQSTTNYRLFVIYHLRTLKALDGIAIESSEANNARDMFGGRLTQDFVAEKLGHSNFTHVRELDFPSCSVRTVDLGSLEQFVNLRSVNLEQNNLTNFSGLIYLVNLRVLCLNNNHIECIVPRPKQPSQGAGANRQKGSQVMSSILNPEQYTPILENLEVLHLGHNGIKDLGALQLSRLSSLKALFLQGNEISKIDGLEGLQDLRELVLDRNKIKCVSEESFINQWNLQELHMEENRIKELSNMACLENLQRLYLGMNRIQDISELEKLEVLPNMIELSVVSNAVSRRLLHRPMLVYRMPNLMIIDGIAVTDEERTKAELYFMEQQAPQATTTMETVLPGIGQYKMQIPVKVTNMQLAQPPEKPWPTYTTATGEEVMIQPTEQVPPPALPRGANRRRAGNRPNEAMMSSSNNVRQGAGNMQQFSAGRGNYSNTDYGHQDNRYGIYHRGNIGGNQRR
ncbi:unnamed protein product [Owenia fusiformis]|uniref:Uncharacterized protein n=1 Tax=Owenia fusiformis TaxID=6347 RepID=A0A8J1U696_OWEFU|nr:unnamed protein product [Owenia fusiformis]